MTTSWASPPPYLCQELMSSADDKARRYPVMTDGAGEDTWQCQGAVMTLNMGNNGQVCDTGCIK